MPRPPERRSVLSALWLLVRGCLGRAGIVPTLLSLVVGGIAGYLVSQQVKLNDQFWSNAAILTIAGAAIGFAFDLLFLSPVRLWLNAERDQLVAEADRDGAEARAAKNETEATKQRDRADGLQTELNGITAETTKQVLRQYPNVPAGATGPAGSTYEEQTPLPAQPVSSVLHQPFTIQGPSGVTSDPTPLSVHTPSKRAHVIAQQHGTNMVCSCGWRGLATEYEAHRAGTLTTTFYAFGSTADGSAEVSE